MRNSTRERSIGKSVFATIALIAMVMAGMVVCQGQASYTTVAAFDGTPIMTVEPSAYHATSVNEIFSVNITLYYIIKTQKLVAYEFKLRYNATLLNIMEFKLGTFLEAFAGPPNGDMMYFGPIYEADYVHFGAIILADASGEWHVFPKGSGTIATITFRATQPSGACHLTLFDTILGDSDGKKIPHNIVSGYYDIGMPTLMTVEPSAYHATWVNETFSVNITVTVNETQRLVAYEFRLRYNATLLDIVEFEYGTFLEAFAGPPNGDMFYFGPIYEADYVYFAAMILADASGEWHVFPKGSGTIATITFRAKTAPQPSAKCHLTLFNTILGDSDGKRIPHNKVSGYYDIVVPALMGDINSDDIVDIYDALLLANAFGTSPGQPHWTVLADLNHDNTVDIFDAILLGKHFGEKV